MLAFIVAIYLAGNLRLSGLSEKSIWYDEAFSILFSRSSLSGIIKLCKNDVLPPLYFSLLHLWLKFFPHSSIDQISFYPRLFSAIFGILSLPLIYLLGQRLFNSSVGILSVLLLTFSPFHLHYSQEIRMYSLFFLIALSLYIKVSDYFTRPSIKNFIFLTLLSTMLIYTHYFGLFLIFSVACLILWRSASPELAKPSSRLLSSPLLAVAFFSGAIFFLYLPWLVPFLHHLLLTRLIIPPPTSAVALNKILNLIMLAFFGYTPLAPFSAFRQINIALLITVSFILALCFFLGILKARREQKNSYTLFLSLFALPVVLILLHLLLRGRFYERYFLPLLPFVFIFTARGLLALKHRIIITIAIALICFVFLGANLSYLQADIRDTTRQAYLWLDQKANANDVVVHNSPKSFLPFKCYDAQKKFRQFILPTSELNIFALSLINLEEIINLQTDLTPTNRRLWLVFHSWQAGDPLDDFQSFVAQWFLTKGWHLTEFRHFAFSVKHIYLTTLQKL